jgi:hypothetical protein
MKYTWYMLLLLLLSTLALAAQSDKRQEILTLHTTLPEGSAFTLGMHSRSPFSIDWGDGVLVSYESGNYGVDGISGTVHGDGWISVCGENASGILSLYIGRDEINQQVDSLDLSRTKGLKFLYCQNNRLKRLDISQCFRLMELDVADNYLSHLDLKNAPLLDMLVCQNNQLRELNLTPVQGLVALRCEYNEISSLDLRHFKGLTVLRCQGNPIEELDISRNRALQQLFAGGTQLAALDLTPHIDLRVLDLSDLPGVSVTWGDKEELRQIFLNRCDLSTLAFPQLPLLDRLEVQGNRLTKLELSGMPLLKDLRCNDNQLESLDLSLVKHLNYLFAEGNRLTQIDLSALREIRELLLSYNQLSSLDLSSNPDLYLLWLSKNPIKVLDIHTTPKLFSLFLDECKLSESSVRAIISSLPDITDIKTNERTAWWKKWLLLKGNPISQQLNLQKVTERGWQVDLIDAWPGRDNAIVLPAATSPLRVIRVGEHLQLYSADGVSNTPRQLSVWLYSLSGELIFTAQTLAQLSEISLENSDSRYVCVSIIDGYVHRTLL